MSTSSRGGQLGAFAKGASKPPVASIHDYATAPGGFPTVKNCLDAVTTFVTAPDDPRSGVLTYAFTRRCDDEADRDESGTQYLRFLEIFADSDALYDHIASENEANAFVEMFESRATCGGFRMAMVNAPEVSEAARQLPLKKLYPLAGYVMDPTYLRSKWIKKHGDRMRPDSAQMLALELWLEPNESDTKREKLLAALKPIVERGDGGRLTAMVVDAWHTNVWTRPRDPDNSGDPKVKEPPTHGFSERALVLIVVNHNATTMCNHVFSKARIDALVDATQRRRLVYTAADWSLAEHTEAVDYFDSTPLRVAERHEVFSGFLLHPMYARGWEGVRNDGDATKSTAAKSAGATETNTDAATGDSGVSNEKKISAEEEKYFTLRHHSVTGALEAFVFNREAADVPSVKDSNVVTVAVYNVANRLANVGRKDREIAAGTLFGQLARLRRLVEDVDAYNAVTDEELNDHNDMIGARCYALTQQLAIFYADVPTDRRVPIVLSGVAELIGALEREYATVIDEAQAAIAQGDDGLITYMGLQELYRIDQLVITNTVGGLGPGIDVVMRVADMHYEPYRSLFGGRRYTALISLEAMVSAGNEFISVQHKFQLDEWMGGRKIKTLEFRPVRGNSVDSLSPSVRQRVEAVSRLGAKPCYVRYAPESFHPHLQRDGGGGATNAAVTRASGGLAVVDSDLGMALGHRPANASDDFGGAIAHALKHLRAVGEKQKGESAERRRERLKTNLVFVVERLASPRLAVIAWPTAVAFSLTLKCWGHVVVDGVSPAPASGNAWRELVLAPSVKEMLRCTTARALRGRQVVGGVLGEDVEADADVRDAQALLEQAPRYTGSPAAIEGKGSGALFLLYGPPGTGKTLSVEAMALLFGRPLYNVSFAELGTSVAELEQRLTDVLALASAWGALVLIDEGDALVEKRRLGELTLNSMSAVLLRLLERFDGALFITSNRAAAFDPAALSRVTLAIHYRQLESKGLTSVWSHALTRVLAEERGGDANVDAFDFDELAKRGAGIVSGRSVGAVVRLALGLCDSRRIDLSQQVLLDALDVYLECNAELADERVAQELAEEKK